LREEFLEPLQMTPDKLATALHITDEDITTLLAEKEAINVDIALRLARYFSTTAQFWLNLQSSYDLKIAERKIGEKITHEIAPLMMAH
jgi:addiction module HigA family antidote